MSQPKTEKPRHVALQRMVMRHCYEIHYTAFGRKKLKEVWGDQATANAAAAEINKRGHHVENVKRLCAA